MKKNRLELIFCALQIPLDSLMIFLAFLLAYFIRVKGDILPVASIMPLSEYLKWILVLIPIWLLVFVVNKLYSFQKRQFIDEFVSIFMAVSTGLMVVFAILFFGRILFFSRLIVLFAWALSLILVTLGRLVINLVQKFLYLKGIGTKEILIIGTGSIARQLISAFEDRFLGIKVIGVINGHRGQRLFAQKPILGKISQISRVVSRYKPHEIIQADPKLSNQEMYQLLEFCYEKRIAFKFAPSLFELRTKNIVINRWGNVPVIELKRTPLDGWGRIIKRIVDLTGSIIGLIILLPFFAIIAILIKLDSPGPVFFRQKRVGLDRNFIFLKFRTMKATAAREHRGLMKKYGVMFKLKNDPRITKIGKWLRRTSIDELPQLWNVLKGEMSLIGPRPPMPEEVKKYSKWQRKRLGVKPGITGLWQVSGRSDLAFDDWVKLDIHYIENWSLKLDFQILLRTFLIVLTKSGAY